MNRRELIRTALAAAPLINAATAQEVAKRTKGLPSSREHLKPWLIGNDADRIEDLWQSAQMKAYRRNGPVNNNVLAAMDMALWERGVLISERPT
jgi:L-alanine-DL-glutamate epimerase-like enolase superfamily enzyme